MRVLITNDDGIDAPWLHDLAAAFQAASHEVAVVAPAGNCSGTSGSLAPLLLGGDTDVRLRRWTGLPTDEAWGAEGCSPSMCVILGLNGFLSHDVDLVVSGANYGWNIGRDIWRSGTVWAAVTAWGMDVPSLAVSVAPEPYESPDRQEVAERTVGLAKQLTDRPEPELWNVNYPAPPSSGWLEPAWVPMAHNERLSATSLQIVERPAAGDALVRLRQEPGLQVQGEPGSDADVVQRGGITMSRLRPLDAVVDPS